MTKEKKDVVDKETILLTLDQIGQTIDVMTSTVSRLKHYLDVHIAAEEKEQLDRQTQALEQKLQQARDACDLNDWPELNAQQRSIH